MHSELVCLRFFGCCFVCVGTILCVKNLGIFSREREAEENLSLHCIPQFFLFYSEKEQGCCIERCPVGSLIVGAMMILG